MVERNDFRAQQYAFAAHIRDPAHAPAPVDVEDRRMAIYRELLFNNVAQLLARTFPVLRKIVPAARWQAIMRDYFARHQAHTPLFLEMPQEFLSYLQDEFEAGPEDPPFLLELAHYEWVELALAIDEADIEFGGIDPHGDVLDGRPVVSPLAWPLAYSFPVHRIGPDFQPEAPGGEPTFLVVYRDRRDELGFIEVNAITARLLELLDEQRDVSGRELLTRIAIETAHPNPGAVVEGGREILEALRKRDVILGTRLGPTS